MKKEYLIGCAFAQYNNKNKKSLSPLEILREAKKIKIG